MPALRLRVEREKSMPELPGADPAEALSGL